MANLSNINNKFIVEDSGDVGIGVTTATTKLHIGGTAPGDSIIRQDSTVSGTNWEIGERAAGKWQIFEDDGDTIVATFMSSGNVGIGTSSPSARLEVSADTGGVASIVRFQNTNSTAKSTRIQLLDSAGIVGDALIAYDHSNANALLHYLGMGVNNSTTLVINNSDNVGIGTTSPGRGLTIDKSNANAALEIIKNNTTNQIVYLGTGSSGGTDDPILQMKHNGAENIRLYATGNSWINGGNVGIGVSSPVGKLQVSLPTYTNEDTNSQQAIFGVDSGYGVRIGYNETDNKGYINVLKPGVAWGSLILQEDVGKVGIGTTSPDEKLDITGGYLKFNGGDYGIKGSNSLTYNPVSDHYFMANGSTKVTIKASGNVGIGITPSNTQAITTQITNGLSLFGNNSTPYGFISNNHAWTSPGGDQYLVSNYGASYYKQYEGAHSWATAPSGTAGSTATFTTRMTILSGGYVGIGTASPQANLHINEDTSNSYGKLRLEGANRGGIIEMYNQTSYPVSSWTTDQSGNIFFATSGAFAATSLSTKFTILTGGNVGIGTTNPSSELEVAGRAIVEKLEVARYSDSNAPAAAYVGRSANPIGQGGIFRLGAIESSSTVNKIDEPFLITYSSGHWGSQPMFFAEFTITYYRGSYVKYWAQHEVSQSRLQFMDGPYGGQIISGGAPVSRTITQLCSSCNGGQPVYKCVWKWSNSGTYIKTSPIVSLVDGHGSARVYTSGSSTESAVDTLYGSASSPGAGYLLMGINNAQAAGFTGLQTQN